MSSYLGIILYGKYSKDNGKLDIKSNSEQEKISSKLWDMYSCGNLDVNRKIKEISSWNTCYDNSDVIWENLPTLYECEDYGDIKYIPENEYNEYCERFLNLIKEYVSDTNNLINKELAELEILIGFYKDLLECDNKNNFILFMWG